PVWDDMSKRAKAFDMKSVKVNGQDVEEVYEKARQALEHARSGKGPVFFDVETKRMHGHYIGDPQIYRAKDDIADAAEHDPIELLRAKLSVPDDEFESMDAEAHEVVEKSVEFAKAGTDPKSEDALKNIYA
ncbi:MAG TPA: thiamine pyrophosphate-dependent enzyme, partial [Gaiellaceae bacterium]